MRFFFADCCGGTVSGKELCIVGEREQVILDTGEQIGIRNTRTADRPANSASPTITVERVWKLQPPGVCPGVSSVFTERLPTATASP